MVKNEINLGQVDSKTLRVALDETTTLDDVHSLLTHFASFHNKKIDSHKIFDHTEKVVKPFENSIKRQNDFLNQEIFNKIHSEHQMLRYLHYLVTKDITLTKSMISLGSCTMKLNATVEMVYIQKSS
jgi:glycine dehydrogenase